MKSCRIKMIYSSYPMREQIFDIYIIISDSSETVKLFNKNKVVIAIFVFVHRMLKTLRMRVLDRHLTKCCHLIILWELNQAIGHSYLPIQQLFDSSLREAACLLWHAAWRSLPIVAFRERRWTRSILKLKFQGKWRGQKFIIKTHTMHLIIPQMLSKWLQCSIMA